VYLASTKKCTLGSSPDLLLRIRRHNQYVKGATRLARPVLWLKRHQQRVTGETVDVAMKSRRYFRHTAEKRRQGDAETFRASTARPTACLLAKSRKATNIHNQQRHLHLQCEK
jgi:hypothetical protein